jgi:hypothetical protein
MLYIDLCAFKAFIKFWTFYLAIEYLENIIKN